jgi:hypothetical protein
MLNEIYELDLTNEGIIQIKRRKCILEENNITIGWTTGTIKNKKKPFPRAAHTKDIYKNHLFILFGGDNHQFLNEIFVLNLGKINIKRYKEKNHGKRIKIDKEKSRCAHSSTLVKNELYIFVKIQIKIKGGGDGIKQQNDFFILDLDEVIKNLSENMENKEINNIGEEFEKRKKKSFFDSVLNDINIRNNEINNVNNDKNIENDIFKKFNLKKNLILNNNEKLNNFNNNLNNLNNFNNNLNNLNKNEKILNNEKIINKENKIFLKENNEENENNNIIKNENIKNENENIKNGNENIKNENENIKNENENENEIFEKKNKKKIKNENQMYSYQDAKDITSKYNNF